jgi:hypothetical protein
MSRRASEKIKQQRREAISHWFEWFIVYGSLGALLIVELALQIVSMSTIAPGPIERIGFMAIGVIMVALIVPSAKRGFTGLWLTFAICASFLNASFVLESTRAQSEAITVENDSELKRLDTLITTKNNSIDNLQSQFHEAKKQETMDKLDGQITDTRTELKAANNDRKAWFELIESGNAQPVIHADDVFLAIPIAVGFDKETFPVNIIKLVFFGALFIAMQRAIVVFASGGNRKRKEDNKPIKIKFKKAEVQKEAIISEELPTEPIASNDDNGLFWDVNNEEKEKADN